MRLFSNFVACFNAAFNLRPLHQGIYKTGLTGLAYQATALRFNTGPVRARFVKIVVNADEHPSMRAGIIVAGDDESVADPPEKSRSYSSVWKNDKPGDWYARSTLDSAQAGPDTSPHFSST